MKKNKIAAGDGKAIAIVGMSGFFPQADDLEAFAQNLSSGRDSVRAISDTRIRYSCLEPDLDYLEAGLLDRVDQFDYRFFRISKFEAEMMDPQQRLLLQLTCRAIEHAGYRLSDFNGSNTGVFLAAPSTSTYKPFLRQEDPAAQMGNLYAVMAGRISYILNLTGPAQMIDTACSSSLVAVIEACKNLQLGLIDYAITGGIRIGSNFEVRNEGAPAMDVLETEDDRCKAFDASANGIVPGEGGGIIVLKMLDQALRDNDTIHAVIRGYASNQDGGRTVGITAPSPQAQKELLLSAWKSAGVDPRTISYIEAHGTGTKLGDPIEIKGMTDAFNEITPEKGFCAVSSVKTNIGHLGTAAGIAGLLKVVLSLKARKLFPSLHFNRPNPHINFRESAVYVNTQYTDWSPACGIRRAGVSSFGISGTNSHVILEEAPAASAAKAKDAPELVTLSAKTYPALKEYLRNVAAFAAATPEPLRDVAFTLNAGRDDYKLRKAFVVPTKEALAAEIEKVLGNWDAVEHKLPEAESRPLILLLSGNARVAPETLQQLARRYAPFRQALDACEQRAEVGQSEQGRLFAWYYALVSLLKALGVSVKNLVGSGPGNLVIGVLSRKLSLEEGLQAAIDFAPGGKAVEPQKFHDYLRTLNAPVCLELGAEGELYGLAGGLPGVQRLQLHVDNAGAEPAILPLIAALYEHKVGIDWGLYYQGAAGRRVTAPTYPFEKTRAWYREPLPLPTNDVAGWLYDVDWTPAGAPAATAPAGKHWLVFMPQSDFGRALGQRLEGLGQQVTRIYFGNGYEAAGPRTFFVRPNAEEDYRQLLGDLQSAATPFDGILHLGNYGPNPGLSKDNAAALLGPGVYAQFLVAKVFSEVLLQREIRFVMVSSNAVPVLPGEAAVCPERSASLGFLRGLVAEYEKVKAKCIDLPGGAPATSADVDNLLAEIGREDKYIVAYRGNQRYVQRLKAHGAAQPPAPDQPLPLKPGGLYVVTGGTDGIGFEISRAFTKAQPIRLIVVGRTDLPGREDWPQCLQTPDDGSSRYRKIRNLQRLAETGSDITYYRCNMGDAAEVTALLGDIYRRHGNIDGLVHSAALPGKKWIKQNTLKEFEEITACRIQGVLALVEGTRATPPDFTVIFSSVSGLLPAYPRKADYAASCVFADTYVRQAARQRKDLKLIHWCDWQETGMSYRVVEDPESFAKSRQFLHVRNAEGVEAFRHCLLGRSVNSIVLANYGLSTAEQRQYLADNPYFTSTGAGLTAPAADPAPAAQAATPVAIPTPAVVAAPAAAPAPVPVQAVATPVAAPAPVAAPVATAPQVAAATAPQTVTATAQPAGPKAGTPVQAGEIEQFLTATWQEVLKVDNPAPGDDFFDLGGHSLNGFKVIRQVEKQYNVALDMNDLFDYPVLRDLAARIFSLLQPATPATPEPPALPAATPVNTTSPAPATAPAPVPVQAVAAAPTPVAAPTPAIAPVAAPAPVVAPVATAPQVAAATAPQTVTATAQPAGPKAGTPVQAGEIEQFLTAAWQEVLKVDNPAPGDDFFDLGGHSLNGFKVIRQVEKQYNVALDMDDLFDYPVLRDLAARIFSLLQPATPATPEPPAAPERPLEPLSGAQQRLWMLHTYGRGTTTTAYNIYKGYAINGALDREAFARSFDTLIERHETLRTVFVTDNDEPRQRVLDAAASGFAIRYIDRRGLPGADACITTLEKEEMERAFDLEKGPLLRATLVQLEDQRYVFLFTVHHIIADGLSLLILVNELLALYCAYRAGQPNPLTPVTAQYRDFARWQREQQAAGALLGQQQYWINELKGNVPELNLVTDFPRPAVQQFGGDMVRFSVDAPLAAALRTAAADAESTLFIHLLAAFSVLLGKYAQQEEMIIGFPVDGRSRADFQETVGMFVNVLPVRSRPREDKTFRVLVQETKSRVLAALRNRDCQYEDLVQWLELPVDPGRNPLFDVLFQVDAIDTAGIAEQEDVQFAPLDFESNAGRFDLHLSLKDDRQGVFTGALFYRTSLFRRETIGQMVENYLFLLRQVVNNPDAVLKDLRITHRFVEPALPAALEAGDFVFS